MVISKVVCRSVVSGSTSLCLEGRAIAEPLIELKNDQGCQESSISGRASSWDAKTARILACQDPDHLASQLEALPEIEYEVRQCFIPNGRDHLLHRASQVGNNNRQEKTLDPLSSLRSIFRYFHSLATSKNGLGCPTWTRYNGA